MKQKLQRIQITKTEVKEGIDALLKKFEAVRAKKGNGSCTSSHEILGLLAEEYHEFVEAVQSNDIGEVEAELMDCAIVAMWGIVCIRAGNIK